MTEQGEVLRDRMEAKVQEHLGNLAKRSVMTDAQLVALLRQIIVTFPAQDKAAYPGP